MEIILKKDVENLGYADDIVKVKTGYAVNYLIPKGYATLATPSAKKQHAETLRQRAHKVAKFTADAETLAAKLNETTLTIAVKVSETGTIYGSVNATQIAEALAAQGIEIDRKNITVETIKALGSYEAKVKCYKDIAGTVKLEVISDAPAAETAPAETPAEEPAAETPAEPAGEAAAETPAEVAEPAEEPAAETPAE